MNHYHVRYHTYSNRGTRPKNEDYIAVAVRPDRKTERMKRGELFIVADGVGGHRSGQKAARQTCERLLETYYSPDFEFEFDDPDVVERILKRIFQDMNDYLEGIGRRTPALFEWGSTASALVIGTTHYYFAHTGDTRIFLLRNGEAELLTEDQNVAYQMLKYHQISYQEYLEGIGHNKLLSYIGVGEGVSIQTGKGTISAGDCFLLCSDGFNQFCQIHDLKRIVGEIKADLSKQGVDFLDELYKILHEQLIDEKIAKDNVTFILLTAENRQESS